MKVRRLNEASYSDIQMAEEAWNAAYGHDKIDILEEFLRNKIFDQKSKVVDKLLEFGDNFLIKWVDAMKWDELGRDNNEFMALLQTISEDSLPLQTVDNFTKIYNVYSDGNIETSFIDGGGLEESFWRSIAVFGGPERELYSRSDKDFRLTLKYLHDSLEKEYSEEDLKNIFFEDNGRTIRSVADIESHLRERGDIRRDSRNSDTKNLSDDQAKDLLDDLLQRNGMINYIKQNYKL